MNESCFLICGLGNPGNEYKNTRHNLGFLIIEDISQKMDVSLKKGEGDYLIATTRHAGKKIFLIEPQSYMNKSGIPVQKVMNYYKIIPENFLIVHDDLDIDLGKVKLALNGGAGGHNGIRSVISQIGTKNFLRLKAGIGKPADKFPVDRWVLSQFSREETDIVKEVTDISSKGILLYLEKGEQFAMNFINSVDLRRKNAD
jgi:PTH1 family peptidyl-tRNA hydrolase